MNVAHFSRSSLLLGSSDMNKEAEVVEISSNASSSDESHDNYDE